MTPRTNWILFGIAMALTAYAWVFEAGSPIRTQRGRLYPDLDPNEIVELRLERPSAAKDAALGVDARPILLRKEGPSGDWWIVEPIHVEAFHPRAQSIAFDIADLMRIAEVAVDGAADPFRNGIDVALAFKTRDGRSFGLELGEEHPDPRLDLVYARETGPGSAPFVIRKEFRKNLLVSLNDMRSRALLGIAPPDATRLEVSGAPQFAKVLVREGVTDRWRLKQPIDAAADRLLVEDLLRELNSWTVASFYMDSPADSDLAASGLATPRAKVKIERKDGYAVELEIGGIAATALVGKETKETEVFVRHSGRPFLFKASTEPLALLLKNYEELRGRYVFDLGMEDVEEIAYDSPLAHNRLRREKEKDGRGYAWQILDKDGTLLFPGDKQDIEAAVVWHRTLTIQQFVAQKLEAPRRTLTFKTSGNRTLELRLGDLSSLPEHQGQNMYPASVDGEPGSYLVSTELPSKLDSGPSSFRQKAISSLDPAQIRAIQLVDGLFEWSLAQALSGDPWMLDTKSPLLAGKELSSTLVNKLLLTLHKDNFRVERFEPAITDFVLNELELQAPKRAVILERVDSDEPVSFHTLLLGARTGERSETLGRVDVAGMPPFILEKEVEDAFLALAQHLHEVTGK